MLEQIMKWLRKILSDNQEQSRIDTNQEIHSTNQSIEARVSYQYPKRNHFRFPVIPDEEPAVNRRKNNRKTAENSRERDERSGPSERKRPFQPSDVPSPVYGYSKKRSDDEKKVEDIPSFIRKRQESGTNQINENIHGRENVSNKKEQAGIVIDARDSFTENREKSVNEEGTENIVHRANISRSEHEQTFHESGKRPQHKKGNEGESDQGGRKNAVLTPFNVIMTPEDRKNVQHKKPLQEKNRTLPPLHLLNEPEKGNPHDENWIQSQREQLELTLRHFHVKAKVTNAMRGPTVTRYEVKPDPGVKVSKITNLSDDIKLNLAARDIRMEAPIPGKNAIGIEVPNEKAEAVYLSEILQDRLFQQSASPLTVALGLDIAGEPVVTDLKKMPHGLIAGATGSGKSVCINTILISLLYKASDNDVRFMLIDPKMVELASYNAIPHLVSPVISDVKAATSALKWAVGEMEERYERFVQTGARDIERYNEKMGREGKMDEKLPYLVIVIDELADLMMVSPQDVEDAICRIAQKARACGIHLLLATQRPSVDVITGLIKANIPTRIAFAVSSQVDSRTIIDVNGAEKLLGKGDMLFLENGAGKSRRIQGAFVSDEEIERVTNFVKKHGEPRYIFKQDDLIEKFAAEENEDDLLYDVIDFVVQEGNASTSLLQRRFKIGYNRAARLVDRMEDLGIISEQKGSRPRDVLMSKDQVQQLFHVDS